MIDLQILALQAPTSPPQAHSQAEFLARTSSETQLVDLMTRQASPVTVQVA